MKKIIMGADYLRIQNMLYSYSVNYSEKNIIVYKDMKCDMLCISYILGSYQKDLNFDLI